LRQQLNAYAAIRIVWNPGVGTLSLTSTGSLIKPSSPAFLSMLRASASVIGTTEQRQLNPLGGYIFRHTGSIARATKRSMASCSGRTRLSPTVQYCQNGSASITLASVFVTTQLPKAKQGLAGGLLNSVLQLGVALLLGFSDILQAGTVERVGLKESYKNTFWLGVASAVAGLVVVTLWGNVPRASSDLTADEKLELHREATRLEAVESRPQQGL